MLDNQKIAFRENIFLEVTIKLERAKFVAVHVGTGLECQLLPHILLFVTKCIAMNQRIPKLQHGAPKLNTFVKHCNFFHTGSYLRGGNLTL